MFWTRDDRIGQSGLLVATIECEHPDRVVLEGVKVRGSKLWTPTGEGRFRATVSRRNAFVNTGLNITLDRLFGLGTPPDAVGYIGASSDNTAVTAATTTLGGTVSIKAFSPAASRSGQTVTAGATFTQDDIAFAIRKVGLLNTSTDAGTGLIDVIGGSGSSPYDKPLTIDLTSAGTFSLTLQVQVTAAAV